MSRAGQDPKRETRLRKEIKGLGGVGLDILFREAQVAWRSRSSSSTGQAARAARRLGLDPDAQTLSDDRNRRTFARLLAAEAGQSA